MSTLNHFVTKMAKSSSSGTASLSANDKKQKLTIAAQALSDVADILKADSHSPVTQKVFDDKINTVNQNIVKLHAEVSNLCTDIKNLDLRMEENNKLLKDQEKMKRLELVSSRTSLGSFNYYHAHNDYNTTSSCKLAKDIIDWFIIGFGFILSEDASMGRYEKYASGKLEFRQKIVAQIKKLIGHDPRLVDNGDGTFAIYYE